MKTLAPLPRNLRRAHLRTTDELVQLAFDHPGAQVVLGDGWDSITVAGQVYAAPAGGAR